MKFTEMKHWIGLSNVLMTLTVINTLCAVLQGMVVSSSVHIMLVCFKQNKLFGVLHNSTSD